MRRGERSCTVLGVTDDPSSVQEDTQAEATFLTWGSPVLATSALAGKSAEGTTSSRTGFRELGSIVLSSMVCRDFLGEIWAGYIISGVDRGRTVLATLLPTHSRSPSLTQLLARAQAALPVRKPEVLALLDYQEVGDEIALISEYIEGEPLSTLLAASSRKAMPFRPTVAVRIIRDAARALASFRSSHPDIGYGLLSPDVLYLPSYGEVLLRQPQLADEAMRQLHFRRQPSALPYRSPEQLRSPDTLSETADVFTLGIILWEMLAHRQLFGSGALPGKLGPPAPHTPQDIERRIRSLPVPKLDAPTARAEPLAPELVALVTRCLQRDPRRRYADLETLADALDALPEGAVAERHAVASTVERLGGDTIRRRHEEMTRLSSIPLRSSAPPSAPSSHFPDEHAQVTLSLPKRADEARLRVLLARDDNVDPSLEDTWEALSTQAGRAELAPAGTDRPGDALSGAAPAAANDRAEPVQPAERGSGHWRRALWALSLLVAASAALYSFVTH